MRTTEHRRAGFPVFPPGVILLALLPLITACVSETETLQTGDYRPRAVVEVSRWAIREGGELQGHLVLLELRDALGPLRYYRVENLHGEWAGHVTLEGRFSRRVPFSADEDVLGYYAMSEGLQLLLGTGRPVALEEVARRGNGSMEASSGRRDR